MSSSTGAEFRNWLSRTPRCSGSGHFMGGFCSFSVQKLLLLDTGKMRCRDVPKHHRGVGCGTPAQLDHGESLLMEVTGGANTAEIRITCNNASAGCGISVQSTSGLDYTTNCYVSYLSRVSLMQGAGLQMLTCINWSLLLIQAASSTPSCNFYHWRHANRQLVLTDLPFGKRRKEMRFILLVPVLNLEPLGEILLVGSIQPPD